MKNHRSGHILVAAGLALTMGLLGACSSNASGDKPGANASSTVKSAEDATLIFAQCMRDKGFDVPDTGLTADNLNDTSDAFNDAINECQQKVGPALGEENDLTKDPAAQEQLVKGAECLRDLGYDVADPEVGKGLNVKDIPSDALQKCFSNQGAQTK
ncbi:hypothetical protein JFX23_06470 [Schaalia cardiffensis]|uniref:Secreted protein n=1 Tax=Schaalia cardiffensis F0333 TaxID=888050 RepID=N6W5N3_9ACTO|nr:hypothetical protein [Schaalia cardiffensis]ENO17800.1 hypothetical protein HMPREF9004_1710 [Schaalia cardiffensis F0333]MBJ2329411.1 hypothetical protein [Schaalia cardiffensis]